jgi:hypothetical protein
LLECVHRVDQHGRDRARRDAGRTGAPQVVPDLERGLQIERAQLSATPNRSIVRR